MLCVPILLVNFIQHFLGKGRDRADAVMACIAINPLLFDSKFEDQFGLLEEFEEENPKSYLERHNIMKRGKRTRLKKGASFPILVSRLVSYFYRGEQCLVSCSFPVSFPFVSSFLAYKCETGNERL
jgi:hypothetical protein